MERSNPPNSRNKEKIVEYTAVPQTVDSPSGFKVQHNILFSVIVGLLAIFFVTALLFALWFWNKWKKRQVYFRVTVVPLVTLSQSRERAKNIYGFLPRSQTRSGQHHSRSIRIFSTESLIPRNLDNSNSEHMFSPTTVHVLQSCRDSVPSMGYEVGIYDNTAISQVCGNFIPAVDYVNIGASIERISTSLEDSHDYVNVPNTDKVSRNSGATYSLSENLQDSQVSEESKSSIERNSNSKVAEDSTNIWVLDLEDSDYHGDSESSSQSSIDYVNVAAADNEKDQDRQHWMTFQDCWAYGNVLWTKPNREKLHEVEELASTNIGGILGWTPSLPFDDQCKESKVNSLDFWDYENIEPLVQDRHSQETSREMNSEESDDYINVPSVIEEGKFNIEHETEDRALTTKQKSTNQDGNVSMLFHTLTSVTT
ncbi:lymphocyte transmembrane adapter 1-like isoform X2 [Macrotis lagotis]|uniref:lymphocyte transmembrane adapter 1-like isoform X2 n=1 Tax=Macrotis lagotis TaxID=92651 RepID=UPI003D69BC2C